MLEMPMALRCKNCEAPVQGQYCAACGQAIKIERITFRGILEDFIQQVVNLDRGFLHTLKDLTRRPGHMIRDYLLGKRKPYLKPLQFYLLMLAIYFTINELLDIDVMEAGRKFSEQISTGQPNTNKRVVQNQVMQVLQNNTKVILSISVFMQALSLRLFYRKSSFNYVEMLVASLFLTGYHYLFSLLLSFSALLLGYGSAYWILTVLLTLVMMVYSTWTITQLFNRHGLAQALKAGVCVFATYAFYIVLSGTIGAAVGIVYAWRH